MLPAFFIPAVAAYFLLALAGLIDKVLLKTAIISPRAYAFYVGILSAGVLVLLPFGVVEMPTLRIGFFALISGVAGVYALWAFYGALKAHEASRVITTVGALVPIFTLLLSVPLLNESLSFPQLLAFGLLVLGGVLISYRENVKRSYTLSLFNHAATAAVLFAISFTFLRLIFLSEPFWNGLFWARIGGVFGALTIVAVPENFRRIYWATKKAPRTAPIPFVLNQALGGGGAVLQNYAIFLGSAALVGALQGVQYVFVLILIVLLARRLPQLREQFGSREKVKKILATVLVAAGLYLLAVG
ncbi:MAG: hypothetical protein BMS9Abin34_044 [Patescibacteria group bacterium]|nr:MAG: hypothetical protein BMS9Abin34_044 [Patescibacteria group bacterium]